MAIEKQTESTIRLVPDLTVKDKMWLVSYGDERSDDYDYEDESLGELDGTINKTLEQQDKDLINREEEFRNLEVIKGLAESSIIEAGYRFISRS